MNRSKSTAIAVISGAVSLVAYYYIALHWLDAPDPWFVAWMLLVAIFCHELGHLVAFEAFGIKARMFFLVILGGAMPERGYEDRFKRLPAWKNMTIVLAGVVGNIAAVLGCAVACALGVMGKDSFLRVVELNGGLIFLNLLPIWNLDGGRFASILFDSIPESQDRAYLNMLSVMTVGIMIAIMISTQKVFLVPAFLMVWGLKKKSEEDDPTGSKKPGALKAKQRLFWIGAYVALIAIGCAMQHSFPPFLKKSEEQPLAALFSSFADRAPRAYSISTDSMTSLKSWRILSVGSSRVTENIYM